MRLNDKQRKLVEQNHNLIYSAMRKFGIRNEKFDDYYGVAAIGLCKAIVYYNPDKQTALSTLVYSCIKNELYDQFDSERSKSMQFNKMVLPYDNVTDLSEDSKSAEEFLLVENNFEENLISTLLFEKIIRTLNNNQQKLVRLRLNGYTYSEIAKMQGVSRQAIQDRIHTIQKKIILNDR